MRRDTRLDQMAVTVTGIDPDTGKVMVRDSVSNEFEVDGSVRFKGMGFPAVGERWVLARRRSMWVLDVQIGAPPVAKVTGSRDGMHPVDVQMLEALAALGLISDETITGIIPAVLDDESDPPPVPMLPGSPDMTEPPAPEPIEVPDDDPDSIPPNHNGPKGPSKDDKDPKWYGWEPVYIGSINLPHTMGNRRIRHDLMRFVQSNVEVFGTQEFWPPERQSLVNELLDRGWSVFRPGSGHADENTIFWRTALFEKLDQFSLRMTDSLPADAPGTAPARYLNGVKLRHRASNRIFWFMDTHYDVLKLTLGNPARIYSETQQTAEHMQSKGQNLPVITVGDFNRDHGNDLKTRNPKYPYAKFRSVGTYSNWSLIRHRPDRGTHGGAILDYVWFTKPNDHGVKPVDHWILTGYYSDHRPVLVKAMFRSKNPKSKRR